MTTENNKKESEVLKMILRLKELRIPHISPYNLGDMGEIGQIIDKLPATSIEGEIKSKEEDYYPGKRYQRLFSYLHEHEFTALKGEMDDIIQIVEEDFKPEAGSQEAQNYRDILLNLYAAVPKQTNDADWWPDELTNAMENARVILASQFTPIASNGYAQGLLDELREKSVRRAIEGFNCYHEQPITFWTTAIAGELGELCNMIKKMQRVKLGGIDIGSTYTSKDITEQMLMEEIGGIVIYLDLLSSLLNISLKDAIVYEFNRVSTKYNLNEFLTQPASQFTASKEKEYREALQKANELISLGDYVYAHEIIKQALNWVKAENENPKADGVYVTRLLKARLVSSCEFVSAAGGWNTSYKPEMFEWLDESPVDRGVEKAAEIFGLDNSWPLSDVLNKLIEAAHILLHKKDYDGHGWEEINHAVNKGKEIVKAIAGAKWAGNDAVEFAEWAASNYIYTDKGIWFDAFSRKKSQTTAQLYNLFKQKQL